MVRVFFHFSVSCHQVTQPPSDTLVSLCCRCCISSPKIILFAHAFQMSRNFAAVVKKILDDDSRAGILGTPLETCDSGQPGFAVVTNLHPGNIARSGGLCVIAAQPLKGCASQLPTPPVIWSRRHVAAPVRPASRRDRGGAVASARVVEARSGSGRTRARGGDTLIRRRFEVSRARADTLTMWRAAKRAAAAALRDAGRGVAASSARPSAPSSSAAAERVAEAAARRHQQRRRSTNAEGLVQLRHIWELETAAAARRRARGDDAAATAMGMIRALRRAGCSWFDVAANPAVRREASNAVAAWESGGGVAAAAVTAATAVRRPEVAARRAARLRRVVPTLMLAPRGRIGPTPSTIPRFGSDSRRAANHQGDDRRRASRRSMRRAGSRAARGAGEGVRDRPATPSGRVTRDALVEVAAFVAAARHAGCSWLDVARHAAFHACVRARVVAGTRVPRHVRATSVHDGAGDVGDEMRGV